MLLQVDINLWSVLTAAVAAMVVGFLWYGPLFGKAWARLNGFEPKNEEQMAEMKKKAGPMYLIMFMGSLVTAYVLAYFIYYAIGITPLLGAMVGLMAAIGFVLTSFLGNYMFAQRPKMLFFIDAGFYLVNLVIMGAIIGSWY